MKPTAGSASSSDSPSRVTFDSEAALDSLREEQISALLYRALEAVEQGPRAELFARLRVASEQQAALWEQQLTAAGVSIPPLHPGPRVRLVSWLVKRLGPQRILPVLAAMKVRGLSSYRSADARTGESSPGDVGAPTERWHRTNQGGGTLRAAVFGVNDGLVSNASLIIGVSAASSDPHMVVITGLSGLLAGSLSMATGEYISVATQRELLEHQLALERQELQNMPEEEVKELTVIYEAKGLGADAAHALASHLIMTDPERGLETLAREELGLDPQSLVSPIAAAVASFASFAGGALIPLIPFLLPIANPGLIGTVVAMELGLLVVGGLMSLFTGRGLIRSALRMALLGSAAAGATFLIGRLVGTAVLG